MCWNTLFGNRDSSGDADVVAALVDVAQELRGFERVLAALDGARGVLLVGVHRSPLPVGCQTVNRLW